MEKYSSLLLSVGGNLDNSREKFERLWQLVEEKVGKVERLSHYYRSAPWGFASTNTFVNAAAMVRTALSPMQALDATQEIERLLGRTCKSADGRYHDRVIDIDLIGCGNMVMQNGRLSLPHPLMAQRKFVLQPLCDICPDWEHPLLHKKVRTLLEECTDASGAPERIYL